MAKPILELFTRLNCKSMDRNGKSGCLCILVKPFFDEVVKNGRCEGKWFDLTDLEKKQPGHPALKYARDRGFRRLPVVIIKHPAGHLADQKIIIDDREKWNKDIFKKEIHAALTLVWKTA